MTEVTIPQAAAALGVSVDTVRRRIKAGLLRATRSEHGAYVVEIPDAAVARPRAAADPLHSSPAGDAAPARPRASDRLFDRRQPGGDEQELRAVRELLEVERSRLAELAQQVEFLRRQLDEASDVRDRLLRVIQTQQEHFGIEQLQRMLDAPPERAGADRPAERPAQPRSA
ncbi:MAG: hypothetical protein QOE92_2404 [Chloroflexota bacterium]|nr:hypothetical protein [Chloroflexota bacterium]